MRWDRAELCADGGSPLHVAATRNGEMTLHEVPAGPLLLRAGTRLLELDGGQVTLREPLGPSPHFSTAIQLAGRWPDHVLMRTFAHPLLPSNMDVATGWYLRREDRWDELAGAGFVDAHPWGDGVLALEHGAHGAALQMLSGSAAAPRLDDTIEPILVDTDGGQALVVGRCRDGEPCAQLFDGTTRGAVALPTLPGCTLTPREALARGGHRWIRATASCADGDRSYLARWDTQQQRWEPQAPPDGAVIYALALGDDGAAWAIGRREAPTREAFRLWRRRDATFAPVTLPCVSLAGAPPAKVTPLEVVVDGDGGAWVVAVYQNENEDISALLHTRPRDRVLTLTRR